jgi:hypothetical protein
MKKYWKSMSIAVITIVTIGFFYIQSTLAGSSYPALAFETVSGNEEVVEDVVIYGDYRQDNVVGDSFHLTAEGIQYNRDLSYIERLERGYRSPQMNELQEEYKDFMRGKHNIFQMAENEEDLVYADVNSGPDNEMEFQIEVLDKASDQSMEFTVDIPDEENYGYIYIEQVLISGDKAKVVTRNHANGTMDSFSAEIHVYDFDIGEQTLVNDETMISYSEGSAGQTMTSVFTLGDGSTNSHAVFVLEQWETGEDGEGMHFSDLAESKVISVDMETNEHSEFELPAELQDIAQTALLEDSILYFNHLGASGLEINAYDLETQEMDDNRSFTVKRDHLDMHMGQPLITIKDGKIYILAYTNEDFAQANLFVHDITSEELAYEGRIIEKHGNAGAMDNNFHIFDMAVR